MGIRENFIGFEDSRLHYSIAGFGSMPLVIFHGFGQSHQVFEEWAKSLEHDYRLFAFDLYFHGESQWPSRLPLEKSDWRTIVGKFLQQEKIERFAVLGYSLGGKFALATLEAFPEKVSNLFLLAPDGVKTSFWYSLATFPFAFRHLFKSMVLHPGRFYATVKVLRFLHLANNGMLRFAESQMDTEAKRRRVYFSWVYFRHLKFSMRKIADLVNRFQIPVTVIAGKYDKVIPARNMEPLLKHLVQKQFIILDAGHNDLIKNSARFING
jgi:pimeloyl-ACP methyl ester carboxylesterase